MKGGANRLNNTILIENSNYIIGARPDCKDCYVKTIILSFEII